MIHHHLHGRRRGKAYHVIAGGGLSPAAVAEADYVVLSHRLLLIVEVIFVVPFIVHILDADKVHQFVKNSCHVVLHSIK